MELRIKRNQTKLLNDYFVHLHGSKQGTYAVGMAYQCVSDKYGKMGEVVCDQSALIPMQKITAFATLISEGLFQTELQSIMRSEGYRATDLVQMCVFHFTTRSDSSFTRLIDTEPANLGIRMVKQQVIF